MMDFNKYQHVKEIAVNVIAQLGIAEYSGSITDLFDGSGPISTLECCSDTYQMIKKKEGDILLTGYHEEGSPANVIIYLICTDEDNGIELFKKFREEKDITILKTTDTAKNVFHDASDKLQEHYRHRIKNMFLNPENPDNHLDAIKTDSDLPYAPKIRDWENDAIPPKKERDSTDWVNDAPNQKVNPHIPARYILRQDQEST